MNLDLYRTFHAVAKSGNITSAAERLHITQPTASYAVKQLENQLGVKLFKRKSKGVALTEEGAVLFRYVNEALQLLGIGEKKIEQLKNLQSGEVRIGVSETLCKYYLLPTLEAFRQQFPHIRIRLIHGNSLRIAEHLHEGNVDFGIVQLPMEDEHIIVREILTMHNCFVTGEKYKFLADRTHTLSELLAYPMMTLSEHSNTKHFLISLFEKNGLTVIPEIELGNIELLKDFARRGFGITMMVEEFVTEELHEEELYKIQVQEEIPARKAGIITLKDTPLSIAASQLLAKFESVL